MLPPHTVESQIRHLSREARSILLRLRALGLEQRAAREYVVDLECDAEADLTSSHQQITRLGMERAGLVSALHRNQQHSLSLALEST